MLRAIEDAKSYLPKNEDVAYQNFFKHGSGYPKFKSKRNRQQSYRTQNNGVSISCETAQNIIEVGKRLIQAKSLVNHGHWQHWLELNFQLTERTAQNFMKCAERFGKTEINFGFSSTQMIALLALPDAEETEKFFAEKADRFSNVATSRDLNQSNFKERMLS